MMIEKENKMIKLFISQPMNGLSDEDVLKERDRAIKCAKKQLGEDIEVLDSYFTEDEPEGVNSGLWWLGKSIELLAQADVAYFVKGWNKARGCLIENECAFRYGIKTITE